MNNITNLRIDTNIRAEAGHIIMEEWGDSQIDIRTNFISVFIFKLLGQIQDVNINGAVYHLQKHSWTQFCEGRNADPRIKLIVLEAMGLEASIDNLLEVIKGRNEKSILKMVEKEEYRQLLGEFKHETEPGKGNDRHINALHYAALYCPTKEVLMAIGNIEGINPKARDNKFAIRGIADIEIRVNTVTPGVILAQTNSDLYYAMGIEYQEFRDLLGINIT